MSKAEKREASKLDIGLVFSSSSSSSSSSSTRPPPSNSSTAAHGNTNEPLINFAEHQALPESWNFPTLPGSGSEGGNTRSKQHPPVILGCNEWAKKETPSSSMSEAWPTLPPSARVPPRRASPPSPPPAEVPGYGGCYYYGGRQYSRKPRWGN